MTRPFESGTESRSSLKSNNQKTGYCETRLSVRELELLHPHGIPSASAIMQAMNPKAPTSRCQEIQEEYARLQSLAEQFKKAYTQALRDNQFSPAKELKAQLENEMSLFGEKLSRLRFGQFNPRELRFVQRKEHYQTMHTIEGFPKNQQRKRRLRLS